MPHFDFPADSTIHRPAIQNPDQPHHQLHNRHHHQHHQQHQKHQQQKRYPPQSQSRPGSTSNSPLLFPQPTYYNYDLDISASSSVLHSPLSPPHSTISTCSTNWHNSMASPMINQLQVPCADSVIGALANELDTIHLHRHHPHNSQYHHHQINQVGFPTSPRPNHHIPRSPIIVPQTSPISSPQNYPHQHHQSQTNQSMWMPPPLSLGTAALSPPPPPDETTITKASTFFSCHQTTLDTPDNHKNNSCLKCDKQPPSSSSSSNLDKETVHKDHVLKESRKQVIQNEAMARYSGMKIKDFKGKINKVARDQYGCRYLQSLIEQDVSIIHLIIGEIGGKFGDLMIDPFGNYLCQKMVELADDKDLTKIITLLHSCFVNVSMNGHGTRAAQKLVENARTIDHMVNISDALGGKVVDMIQDLNGNHVIQKCLMSFGPEYNQFIYNVVSRDCLKLGTHKHGCCVFQRCIDYSSDSQKVQLARQVISNVDSLVQDPYGNYVVQYFLDLQDSRFTNDLIQRLVAKSVKLSVQKFSSNVMEKVSHYSLYQLQCIKSNTPYRTMIIQDLTKKTALERLVKDPYGNYVIQTALEFAEPKQRLSIIENVLPILSLVKNTAHGKKLQIKVYQYLPMYNNMKESEHPIQ